MGDFKASIMGFFGFKYHNAPLTTYKRRPDDYFSQSWIDKPDTLGLKFIGWIEHKSRKALVKEYLDYCISKRMGELIHEHNEMVAAARAAGVQPKPTRYSIAMRRMAKELGADISKFI